MSLINQMLQDLDARRDEQGVGNNLPNDVRPLPVTRTSPVPIVLGTLGLMVLVAGVVLYWDDIWGVMIPVAAPPATVASAPAAVAPPPAVAPVSGPEIIVPPEPPQVGQAPSETALLQGIDGSLRIDDSRMQPAARTNKEKPVAARSAPKKLVPAEKKFAVERSKTEPDERPAPVPSAIPAKTPLIERTDSVGTARDRADSEYRKAIASINQGRVSEAMEGLRNALRHDGLHSASRQLLVKLHLEAKRPEDAILVLQEGLQEQPAQLGWAMSLARLQVDRGDMAGAWQTLDHSIPAAGRNADYQGFAAHVLHRLGRFREAAGYYQAATLLSPGDGRWWLGLGLSLEADGRSAEARQAFLRARQSGTLSNDLAALAEQKLR